MKKKRINKKVDKRTESIFYTIIFTIFIGVILLDVYAIKSTIDLGRSLKEHPDALCNLFCPKPKYVYNRYNVVQVQHLKDISVPAGKGYLPGIVTFKITPRVESGYIKVSYNKSLFSTKNFYLINNGSIPITTLDVYYLKFYGNTDKYVSPGEYSFEIRIFDSNNNLISESEEKVIVFKD